MKKLEYKGYLGSIEYSENDETLFGKVQHIKGLISFEGCNISDLKKDFEEAVDEYLEECKEEGIEPENYE